MLDFQPTELHRMLVFLVLSVGMFQCSFEVPNKPLHLKLCLGHPSELDIGNLEELIAMQT